MKTRTCSALTILATGLLLSAATATAATRTWSGGGADDNMGTAANWYELVAPVAGDDLVFGATNRPNPIHQMSSANFTSIAFTNGGFSLEAQSDTTKFVLATGITNRAEATSANNTIRVAIYLTNALTIVNDTTRTLNFNPDTTYTNASTTNLAIDNGGHMLTFDGAGNITFGSTTAARRAYIRGTGGLTKNGAGTLTLNGTNTYTGGTVVNDGAVALTTAPTGAGAILVANGARLTVLVHAAGATLPTSRLTLGSTPGGAVTNDFNLSTNASPTVPVVFTTTLLTTGHVYVNVTGTLSVTNYPLIKYATIGGDGFGAFTLGTLPPGVAATLVMNTSNNSVDLNVTVIAGSKLWTGAAGSSFWDFSSLNWTNTATGLPATYNEYAPFGDLVRFDDSGGNLTVDVVEPVVKPYSVTVNNSVRNYWIKGNGHITGTGFLVKQGSGKLQLSTINDFSGGCRISDGLLMAGNDSALGSGLVTLAGGGLSSDSTTARTFLNAISVTADSTLGDAATGVLTLEGPVNYNNGTRSLTIVSDVIMTGGSANGRLNKLGGASLVLKGGTHDWNGTAEVREGMLLFDGASVTNTTYIRTDAGQLRSLARIVVTNGAVVVQTNNSMRVGYNGYLTTNGAYVLFSPTNLLDVAGTVLLNGSYLQYGDSTNLSGWGIVNLWTNGTLKVTRVQHVSDGSNYNSIFNFRGGLLQAAAGTSTFMQGLTNASVYGGGAIIDSAGHNITILQNLLAGDGGGGLTKIGTGSLLLNGANTYTGITAISNGTLGGTGVISGPVIVSAGATLAPGAPFGNLTISNALVLQGTTVMDVAKADTTVTNEQIRGLTSVTYGGTLQINNAGTNALAAGDTFQLFSAAGFTGKFSAIIPSQPGSSLLWDARGLTNNGTLAVVSGVISVARTNSQLILSWSSNLIGVGWVQVQTNSRTVGLSSNWSDVLGSGNTNQLIVNINPANGTVFYRLVSP